MTELDRIARQACACGTKCATVRRVKTILERELVAAWADGVHAGLRLSVHVLEQQRGAYLPAANEPVRFGWLDGASAALNRAIDRLKGLLP